MAAEKYLVSRLHSENYFNWCFRVEMLLKEKDLPSVIEEVAPVLGEVDLLGRWIGMNYYF